MFHLPVPFTFLFDYFDAQRMQTSTQSASVIIFWVTLKALNIINSFEQRF